MLKLSLVPPAPEDYRINGVAPEKQIVPIGQQTWQVAWDKRLQLQIENTGDQATTAVLVFDGNPTMTDYPYVRDRATGEWRPLAGVRDGNMVLIAVPAPPGITDFSVSPPYSYEDCAQMIRRIAEDHRVTVSVPGQSAEGRDLWLLKIAAPDCPDRLQGLKQKCMIAARAHAWETAGSYCIEGMLDYLLSDHPRAAMYLQMFDVYFCPMLNPDGVANGVRRHTPDGADLNRDIPTNRTRGTGCENDPELVCHIRLIDELRPQIYCQIHNMNQKHIDCALGMLPDHAEYFKNFMPPLQAHLKTLGFDQGGAGTIPKYCRNLDPACLSSTFEFPWFGRTTGNMRALGPPVLEALFNTRIRADQRKPAKSS
ncbi:MAG: M14 family zinc carboxypeptidase [Kiritimatiellia bacterium]|nr:hypothetical protein [Lentisphaerota bacterium]